jgi:hypothetical protein
MRLGPGQVRFTTSFLPTWRRRTLRLGGRRGAVHLQEPALVLEGEFLRFKLFMGIEWLFRRALSEWTTVTVPYSRIERVRVTRVWRIRLLSLLVIFAAWGGLVATASLQAGVWMLVFAPVVGVLTTVLGYVTVRVGPTIRIDYRTKAGRRTRACFLVHKRLIRAAFVEALAAHRAAAARHSAVPVLTAAEGT